MSKSDIQATVKRAEKRLNEALGELEEAASPLQRQILEMRLQACIFQYDICAQMASVISNDPAGFAKTVALNGMVLRLFEYDQVLNKQVVAPLLDLAEKRRISFEREALKQAYEKWQGEIRKIEQWSGVGDKAAGDGSPDISAQTMLLKQLDVGRVMSVTQAFLGFNVRLLKALNSVGEIIPAANRDPV